MSKSVDRTEEQVIEKVFESRDFLAAFEVFSKAFLAFGTNKNDQNAFLVKTETMLNHYYTTAVEVELEGLDGDEIRDLGESA